jgi:hypothetical protein
VTYRPRVGDHVRVDFMFYVTDGRVLDVYDSSLDSGTRVVVEVNDGDPDDPIYGTYSVDLSRVEPVAA